MIQYDLWSFGCGFDWSHPVYYSTVVAKNDQVFLSRVFIRVRSVSL